MTPEERAKALLNKIAPEGRMRWDASISVEEAIAAAENEALVRAAEVAHAERFNVEVKTSAPLMSCAALDAERTILALRHPSAKEGGK